MLTCKTHFKKSFYNSLIKYTSHIFQRGNKFIYNYLEQPISNLPPPHPRSTFICPIFQPPPTLFQTYLCMSSRASASRVRGFLACLRRFGCSRGRMRFHWVTQPACITLGSPCRIAFIIVSSHRFMAWILNYKHRCQHTLYFSMTWQSNLWKT